VFADIPTAQYLRAFAGEIGHYHATNRTSGNDLFINPLMSQYWTFGVSRRLLHGLRQQARRNQAHGRCQKSDRILQEDDRIAASSADTALKHDQEKWIPVFRKDDAQSKA
jgi:hypothetical protein